MMNDERSEHERASDIAESYERLAIDWYTDELSDAELIAIDTKDKKRLAEAERLLAAAADKLENIEPWEDAWDKARQVAGDFRAFLAGEEGER